MSQPPSGNGPSGSQPWQNNPHQNSQQWPGQQSGGPRPQQGYQQPGYAAQGYQQQPQKKKGGCLKFGLIALAALVVLGIVIAAVGGGGGDDSPKVSSGDNNSQSSGTDEKAGGGVEFKGKTDKDTGANAGDTITQKNVSITSSPLTVINENPYLPTQLCTTVTIKNDSDKQQSFNTFDWKLQDPNGAAKTASFMTPEGKTALSAGEITPGGQTSGEVCFDGDPASAPGEYVVLYQGNVFVSSRLGWVNKL